MTQGSASAKALAAARATLRLALALAGTLLFIFLMAGIPLLFSDAGRKFTFAPELVPRAAIAFLGGVADGSVFILRIGNTSWDFRELGLPYFLSSLAYTALPGALGLGFGAFAGIAGRRRRPGLGSRAADLILATPDFLVIFVIQAAAAWLSHATGLRLTLGVTDGRLALVPMVAMSLFPFFFAFRTASLASRRAEGEEYITSARARGIGERSIAMRHVGAVVIPRLETDLPILIAFMQGSLFVAEQTFLIPGLARFLFHSAFSGDARWSTGPLYQYNAATLALIGLVLSCTAAYFALRLSLAVARRALTHE